MGILRCGKFSAILRLLCIGSNVDPLERHIGTGPLGGIIIDVCRKLRALGQNCLIGQTVCAGGLHMDQHLVFHTKGILGLQQGSALLPGKIAGIAVYRRTFPAGQVCIKATVGNQGIFFLWCRIFHTQCLQRHHRSYQQHS